MFNAPRSRASAFSPNTPFGGGGGSNAQSNGLGSDPLAQSAYAPEVDDPWGSAVPSGGISASTPNLMGGGEGGRLSGIGGMFGFGSGGGAGDREVLPESSIPPLYTALYDSLDTGGTGDVSLSSLNRLLGSGSGGLGLPASAIEKVFASGCDPPISANCTLLLSKVVNLVTSSSSSSTISRQQFFLSVGLAALVQQGKEPSTEVLLRTSPLPIPSIRGGHIAGQSTSSSSGLTAPPPPNRGLSASSSSAFGGSPWGGSGISNTASRNGNQRQTPTSPPNPKMKRQDTWQRQESYNGPSASVNGNISGVSGPDSPGLNGYTVPSTSVNGHAAAAEDSQDAYLTGAGGFGGTSSTSNAGVESAPKGWWKDVENVDVSILEKEGYFLQKYRVEGDKRTSGAVIRRYSDFLWLLDVLSKRYPFRLLPNLPPKRIGPDQAFLEQRRKGLKRFMNAVVNHPIICDDGALAVFMTEPNFEAWRKRMKVSIEEESTSRKLDQAAEMRIPSDLDAKLGVMRQSLPLLLEGQNKLVVLAEKSLRRVEAASGDQSRIAMTLATLGERYPESCWRCAGEEAGGGGIGGGGCDLCKGVGRGLGAIGEAWAREGEDSDKRVKALTLSSLEALKAQRDLYIAFRDLLVRHDRLSKDSVETLRKRVDLTQKKLDSIRNAKRPGWDIAAEKLVASVEQDNSAITVAMTRRVFIRHCIWHELSVVLHSRQAAQNTLGWRQYATERSVAIAATGEIWKGLASRLEDMPVD